MQHDEAIRTHAAERYLLGEMPPAEREVYEDHYFGCDVCGNELSAAAAFLDNARAAMAERAGKVPAPPPAAHRSAESWWAHLIPVPAEKLVPSLALAAVVLLAVAGYQNLAVIPELRQQLAARDTPQAVPTVALRSAARGAGPVLSVQASDAFAILQADVLSERRVARYAAALQTPQGREQFRTSVVAPEPGMPVTLLVPVRELSAGDYTLVFTEDDASGREAGRFTFTLERH